MKSKIMAGVLMFIIISVLLTGCGGKQKEIPYPDGYYVPKPEETETAGKSDKSQKNASETAKETTRETIQARAGSETENKKTGEKGYAAATGSKGFRWLESEMVKQLDKQSDIDRGYYNNMVDEAVKSLSVHGDFERFAADEPYVSDNTPPWFGAGEPHEDDTTPFDVR